MAYAYIDAPKRGYSNTAGRGQRIGIDQKIQTAPITNDQIAPITEDDCRADPRRSSFVEIARAVIRDSGPVTDLQNYGLGVDPLRDFRSQSNRAG